MKPFSLSFRRWAEATRAQFPELSDEQLRQVEAKFMARYAGETRANKPLFLPPGVKMQKLQITPAEMDYTASSEQIRDMILAAFGVPATIAGINKNMKRMM